MTQTVRHQPANTAIRQTTGLMARLSLGLVLLVGCPTLHADTRTALVIGNGNYTGEANLPNAVRDAEAMASALMQLGFKVLPYKNLDQAGMEAAVQKFADALRSNGGAGLFYYSGHAFQAGGHSYLAPIGAKVASETDARYKTLDVEYVLGHMEEVGSRMNLVILDACRDNPFTRGFRTRGGEQARGLSRVDAPEGTLIAYATSPGKTAADGQGEHSPYTAALLQVIRKPGLPVEQVFKEVRVQVAQDTENRQIPWESSSLLGDFYFKPASGGGRPSLASAPEPIAEPPPPRPQAAEPNPASTRSLKTGDLLPRDPMKIGGEAPPMIYIAGGSFLMGSPASEANREADERQHAVTVAAYAIGQYEVTFDDYDRFARATGHDLPNDQGWGRGTRPVINVSWQDATDYAAWLSRETGQRYRLPTEAEWEYAARAGSRTAYWWGDTASHEYANYGKDEGFDGLAEGNDRWVNNGPVGSFQANAWGLYDSAGNVWEWTCSAYDRSYSGAEQSCAKSSNSYAVRGGGWYVTPAWVRSAHRGWNTPAYRDSNTGFRLSRTL